MNDQGYPLDEETAVRLTEKAKEEIVPLEFLVTDTEGTLVSTLPSTNFPLGCLSIGLFLALGFLSVTLVREPSQSVRPRFSRGTYYTKVLLPRVVALALVLGTLTVVGAAFGRLFMVYPVGRMVGAVLIYTAILAMLFSLLLLLPVSGQFLITAITLNALLSLVLCPVYRDFALYHQNIQALRYLSAPYWLYQIYAVL